MQTLRQRAKRRARLEARVLMRLYQATLAQLGERSRRGRA